MRMKTSFMRNIACILHNSWVDLMAKRCKIKHLVTMGKPSYNRFCASCAVDVSCQ